MILNEFFNLPQVFEKDMTEAAEQQYLWHGSRQKIPMLEPRQSVDTGGAAGSNQNAIYATSDPKVAIAMGLTTPGSDTGMFPNDPQMVLFSGKIRKGENVYLHKLPFNGPDGKPQFVQGGNSREFHSVPGVKGIKPTEIKAVPVDKYLNLIRQATPADLELRKKYMKEGEPGDLEHELEKQDYQRRQQRDWDAEEELNKKQEVTEVGHFLWDKPKPNPVLPIVAKIDKVARELTPQNVETGKQIIQSHTRDITRMLSPQTKAGVNVIEGTEETPFGSVSSTNPPSNQKPYVEPSRQDIWDKNDLVNRQAEAREQKQLTLRYARKHGRQAMEDLWAERTDVRMSVEEILEFLDATVNDPGLTPEEFMGTSGLDEGTGQDRKSWMASIKQQHSDVRFVQAKMPGAPIIALVNGKPVAQFDTKKGVAEAKDDYVPPKEADYGKKYQAMVKRVGEKARAQEKAKQQQPKAPVRESRLALLKQIIQS